MKIYYVVIYLLLAGLEVVCLFCFRKRVKEADTLPAGRVRLWQFLTDLPVLWCMIGRLAHASYMERDYLWLIGPVLLLYLVNMVLYWPHRRDLWPGTRLLLILADVIVVGYLALSPLLPGDPYEGQGLAYKFHYAAMALLVGQRLVKKMDQKE